MDNLATGLQQGCSKLVTLVWVSSTCKVNQGNSVAGVLCFASPLSVKEKS